MTSSLDTRVEIEQFNRALDARFDAIDRRLELQFQKMEFRIVAQLGGWLAFLLGIAVILLVRLR
jgi:hypothetical protein